MHRIVLIALLSGCSLTVNGDRLWGQARVDRFVESFAAERCRVLAGCADDSVDLCIARQRALMGSTTDCRFQSSAAGTCLAELADRTCDDGPQVPGSCFGVLQRCDVFIGEFDTGFERGDTGF